MSTKRKPDKFYRMENAEVLVSTRISRSLHAKIVERQKEAKKKTGFKPTVSAVVRMMIEEAARKR